MFTLTELIGWAAMQKMVKTPMGGVASIKPIDQILAQTTPLDGLMAQWNRTGNARTTAPLNDHGADSRELDQEGIEEVSIKCMHALNHITHKGELLSALRSFGNPDRQIRASELIEFQTEEFVRKHKNMRNASLVSLMTLGACYLNGKGDILPSSSGAVRTVSFGANYAAGATTTAAPITATGTLAFNSVFPDGTTGGDWATAGTDISAWIAGLQALAIQKSGRVIRNAIYGANIPIYMRANTASLNWQQGAFPGSIGEKLAQNIVPAGLFGEGITWYPGSTLGYKDSTGTYRYWIPADYILFLPDIDTSWIEVQEGSEEVPTGEATFDDAPAAVRGGLETASGLYSVCTIAHTPPAKIKQHIGDNWMPALKDANAFFYAKVH